MPGSWRRARLRASLTNLRLYLSKRPSLLLAVTDWPVRPLMSDMKNSLMAT